MLCREDGGVLDDLFTYRLEADRYLTVTNASNHERDLAWFREQAEGFADVEVADRLDDYAMLAVQGPRARELVQAISDAPLPAADDRRHARPDGRTTYWYVEPATLARTASSCSPRPATPPHCGTSFCGAAPSLPGSPRATRCAWRPAFTCTATTCRPSAARSRRGSAGAARRTRGSSAPRPSRARRGERHGARPEKLVAFTIEGPGIARQGNPVLGGGEVTSGTLSPSLEVGIGMAYVPAARAAVGTRLEIDVRGKIRPAVVKQKPLYRKGT